MNFTGCQCSTNVNVSSQYVTVQRIHHAAQRLQLARQYWHRTVDVLQEVVALSLLSRCPEARLALTGNDGTSER